MGGESQRADGLSERLSLEVLLKRLGEDLEEGIELTFGESEGGLSRGVALGTEGLEFLEPLAQRVGVTR